MSSPAGRQTGRALRVAAVLALSGAAGTLGAQQPTPPAAGAVARDSVPRPAAAPIVPLADQPRGIDAELRVALYELTNDRYVAALARLEWLQTAPGSVSAAGAPGALRGREDASFLLAQTYYRLGLDEAFRKTAEPLVWTSEGGKYASLLRSQLLLEAYRRGDYAGAKKLAEAMGSAATPMATREAGLGALVAGLTAYSTGRYAEARTAFAKAQESGAPFAAHAQYMDAIAQLRADTTQTAAAIQSLQTLASATSGELADQARVTAAEIAYESGDYAQAATLASAVSPNGELAPQALLTRAWALFKSDQIGPAGESFSEFARRFPELPERDEARLMSAQAVLQLGRADEAGRLFRAVADSVIAESGALQGRLSTAMSAAARALVSARAAGLLFVSDPATGKTIALDERVGAGDSVLGAVVNDVSGSIALSASPVVANPDLVTYDDVRTRLDSLGAPLGGDFPRRVLFTPASAATNRAEYATRSSALYDADVQVAVARYRLQQQVDAQQRQLALLRALQRELSDGDALLGPFAAQLTTSLDSLTRLATALDAAAAHVQSLFQVQLRETRTLAAENAAAIDSVRTTLGASATAEDAEVLRLETATAATYADLARTIEAGMAGALRRHPVFALRDSVRAHGDRIGRLLAETRGALTTAQSLVAQDIARLESGEGDQVRRARATLAAAESRRSAAEAQVVAIVERELNARAGAMLASLRRDTEAAEFGAASAAFFQATDAGRTAGTPGPGGGSAGVSTGVTQDVAGAGAPRAPGAAAGTPAASTPSPK